MGRTIGGTYVLQEIIGVGGMGRVYRAEQTTLGRTVAIKVIHPHLLGDEQTVARFYTEARAASRLNHPNSVSVIDFGRTEDGILYLAMEFLKGKDLALVMHEEGPLPFKRVCDILATTLDALGEAHALDIVHRDLKPENIILRRMRTGEDLVKVVDFGLATIISGGETSITRPGLVCGTPDYMAPEQGRGEDVDGRGDLYAAGVVLFELLTDQLPFEADTPTKVVLRHINDPIPDPREVAPHRQIPDGLAEICLKALAKKRDDRFQSAAEMSAGLRRARAALDANRSTTSSECPACGTLNPTNMRFCGACGTRLTGELVSLGPPSSSATPPPKPSFHPTLSSSRHFLGRHVEMARLDSLRAEASARFQWIRLEGEVGVGKTRLLREAAERFSGLGDLVVGAGPDPSGALAPYGAIRILAARLLEVEEETLAELATDETTFSDPLTRAGLAELAEPVGLRGCEHEGRVGAVAHALATVIRLATARRSIERAVLVVDDVYRADGLTLELLAALPSALESDSVLLILGDARHHLSDAPTLELRGLGLEDAGRFLAGRPDPSEPLVDADAYTPAAGIPSRRLLPFYLEQIEALGGDMGDETLPPRLADAVAQRVERLSVRALRALQALSAFGGRATRAELVSVADPQDLDAIGELVKKGLVLADGDRLDVTHHFLAELVEAFIPASARRELHQKILDALTERGAPLERLAEHAYRANVPMRTFMILERAGDLALDRGDARSAVVAYRRALELSRREMLENGDTVMDTALVTFSRKLGWALARAGDIAGADGVVREVLDLTAPHDSSRARMHLALGRIAALRERPRDAMRHFGQALEIVAGVDARVELAVQHALGRLRRQSGDPALAANAYRRAIELAEPSGAAPHERAQLELELAEVLLREGNQDPAIEHAQAAGLYATRAGSPALEASARALLARAAEINGDLANARTLFEAAADLAAHAGDARAWRRWREAATLAS